MRIDAFCHILPPRYLEALSGLGFKSNSDLLSDMPLRVKEMRTHEGLRQILTVSMPELFEDREDAEAVRLAALANDALAEVLDAYPEDFAAGIATVYMGDVDAALREIERCVTQYRFRGVQLTTTFRGKPLSSPEFFPIYEQMARLDLPVEVHPCHGPMMKPEMIFNWPIETSWMMIRLSTSGVFERWPEIKFVTHHCGGMIPVWHNRIYKSWYLNRMYEESGRKEKSPEEYFYNLRKFYNDTALYGDCTTGLLAGIDFFGADHILFGTDYPLNGDRDPSAVGETANTIASIERLPIPEEERSLIFEGNARRIFKL